MRVAFFIWGDAREACAFCGWHIKMGVWWWSDEWGMGVGAVLDALRVSNNEIIFG